MFRRTTILTAAAVPAMATLGLGTAVIAPAAHATTPAHSTPAVTMTQAAPVLYTGSRGSAVRAWQHDIDQVAGKIPGVPHIATDGVFGYRTTAATKDFQRFAHISIDGVVGPQTRAAMKTALHGASAPTAVLYTGSRGPAVHAWQHDIDQVAGKIPGVPHIATDGIFGYRTTAATKDFQRFAHISIDGVVGPQTRAAMKTALHGAES